MATGRAATILAAILVVAFLARWSEGGGEATDGPAPFAASPDTEAASAIDLRGRLEVPMALQADRVRVAAPAVVEFLFAVEGRDVVWIFDADGDDRPESTGNGTVRQALRHTFDTPGRYVARLAASREAFSREATLAIVVSAPAAPPLVRVNDPDGDARLDDVDLRWFEARTQPDGLEVTVGVSDLARAGPFGTQAEYRVLVDGRAFASYLEQPTDTAPTTVDPRGRQLPAGTSAWDEERDVVLFRLPTTLLAELGILAPYDVVVASRMAPGGVAVDSDRAPDEGSAHLPSPGRTDETPSLPDAT